jgi:GMP synthase (glutamine-hydrolysing)
MKRPLLILKTGETLSTIATRRGDFEVWIGRALGLAERDLELVCVYREEALPDPSEISGVVVTGSPAMVSAREPWSERTAAWLPEAMRAECPVLGICYGHQLLAHGLGGEVGPNPRGREIGTVKVRLEGAEDDALLGGLPDELVVHATHVESVLSLPEGAVRLGSNEADPYHAFRIGERTWGVQFHPEFDADVMRGYITGRRADLEAEGIDADRLLEEAVDSPHGDAILARFAEIVRSGEAGRDT